MRAVFFDKVGEPLQLVTMPDPEPGEGEMIIQVRRCGICGSDVHLTQMHGFYPEQSVLGHEFAGEVVALGKGVEGYKIGDHVSALPAAGCGACQPCLQGAPLLCEKGVRGYAGGFADFMRISASTSIHLPQTVSMSDGALVEPLSVSLHGVAMAKLQPGARVLVVGAGAIGLAAIYWARRMGAGRIVAISRSRRRAEMAVAMGADAFVTTGETEVEDVREALGGAPQVVFEAIGAVGGLQQSINHVATNGTVVSLGFCLKPDPILPSITTFKQVTLIFSMAYTLGEFQFCADSLSNGHVDPKMMISNTIRLEDVPDMVASMQAGTASEVKVHADMSL